MSFSSILGCGSYLPQRIVTNDDLAKTLETSDEWIYSRTGIKQRHIVSEAETTTYMAEQACRQALAHAGIEQSAIGLVIVATTTPDQAFPSTAILLQDALQIARCIAFDVSAACAGFIYALNFADLSIRSGQVDYALVVGSEIMSRLVDWTDRKTCILFGDGAGAVVLGRSEQPGIHKVLLNADGSLHHLLYSKANIHAITTAQAPVQMQGGEVFKHAVTALEQCVVRLVEDSELNYRDIDWLVPHQANARFLKAIAKKLALSEDKVVQTIARHANTSAASVPLALDEAVKSGQIKRGDNLIMEAFGAGFTWGGALLTY